MAVADNNNDIAIYSTDCITWAQTTMPSKEYWESVCYGDGKFMAVAQAINIAVYSTDGINWTRSTLPASGNRYSVCYGNGKFIAVANNNNSTAAYLKDSFDSWA